ncbi:MAG TPA: helix-turn-helix transcriptional regulator [Roseateles sp.]|uniref:helix-turn-helix domain-containing protein n=1 Tax=Roseateles sp. TaxID=1971397 RepID=UPI002ED97C12
MNKRIDFQTINDAEGRPAFVVVPYAEFVARFEQAGDLVPDAVVKLAFDESMSPAKAWRTHLGLTQDDMAGRMGITQSAYAQLETSANPRKSSRERIAQALGISAGQLDF